MVASSSNPAAVIIGAGPHDLSIAAHLRSQGVDIRIFGLPMHSWRANMPQGMFLKSEGWASNLFDPAGSYSLKQYCTEQRLPYSQYGAPVSRESGETCHNRGLLQLQASDGTLRELTTDHVIAATGYLALTSLPFLSERLLPHLRSVPQTPVLSHNFESSVPGLYFTGVASAKQFGPAMRFLQGADYTSRRVSGHICG
ncbi:MAG: putative oxidoreductase [Bryobacterales bacterium]|nr:putative oxidoreductase [Bryobacterales bacterium]